MFAPGTSPGPRKRAKKKQTVNGKIVTKTNPSDKNFINLIFLLYNPDKSVCPVIYPNTINVDDFDI